MSAIEFDCPYCSSGLSAPLDWAGQAFACPACGQTLAVPHPQPETPPPEPKPSAAPSSRLTTCADCGKPVSRSAVACPHCGAPIAAPPPPPVAAPAPPPPTPKAAGEKILWQGHPIAKWFVTLFVKWGICLFLFIFSISKLAMLEAPDPSQARPTYVYFLPIVLLVAFFLLFKYPIQWVVFRYSRFYRITTKKVVSIRGILSKNTSEIFVEDIRMVVAHQRLFDRLLNTGTLHIGTAATAGMEINVLGVPDPDKIKSALEAARAAAQ